MHIYGRSDILDELALSAEINNPEPVRYDIRKLSREIMQRSNGDSATWMNENRAKITLVASQRGVFGNYELYVDDAKDPDQHRYIYSTIAPTILHEYPPTTWCQDEDPAELRQQIETFLLSGPALDKVPNIRIENSIRKSFSSIARKLTMENLIETVPDYRSEIYTGYLATTDTEEKKKLIRKLHEKTLELATFAVGANEFEYAFDADLSAFSVNQKQILPPVTE